MSGIKVVNAERASEGGDVVVDIVLDGRSHVMNKADDRIAARARSGRVEYVFSDARCVEL